jgi:hypothetical protein
LDVCCIGEVVAKNSKYVPCLKDDRPASMSAVRVVVARTLATHLTITGADIGGVE